MTNLPVVKLVVTGSLLMFLLLEKSITVYSVSGLRPSMLYCLSGGKISAPLSSKGSEVGLYNMVTLSMGTTGWDQLTSAEESVTSVTSTCRGPSISWEGGHVRVAGVKSERYLSGTLSERQYAGEMMSFTFQYMVITLPTVNVWHVIKMTHNREHGWHKSIFKVADKTICRIKRMSVRPVSDGFYSWDSSEILGIWAIQCYT